MVENLRELHELDLETAPNGSASVPARVVHVNPAGAVARVELTALDGGLTLQVELPPERWQELRLTVGDTAYVLPRKARVFVPDYSI